MIGSAFSALGRIPLGLRLSTAALLVTIAVFYAVDAAAPPPRDQAPSPGSAAPPSGPERDDPRSPALSAKQLAALPEATTHTTLAAAPRDTSPAASNRGGLVVHNTEPLAVFTRPGGRPFARLPTRQVGNPTWLPVIDEDQGWLKVLLPSKPNGSSGWLDAARVRQAHTPYEIRVNLARMSMSLTRDDSLIGRWTVGIGRKSAPTPTGRTFLLASIKDRKQTYSPMILPLERRPSSRLVRSVWRR